MKREDCAPSLIVGRCAEVFVQNGRLHKMSFTLMEGLWPDGVLRSELRPGTGRWALGQVALRLGGNMAQECVARIERFGDEVIATMRS